MRDLRREPAEMYTRVRTDKAEPYALDAAQRDAIERAAVEFVAAGTRYGEACRMFELAMIHAALRLENGNHAATARRLDVHENTVWNKLRRAKGGAA